MFYPYGDAETTENLNTDRLMNEIRDCDQIAQRKGRNFNSRKTQKSDEFKITFACASKKASMDLDQASNSYSQNQHSLGAKFKPGLHLSVSQENLVSFNRNDFQVQSP